VRNEGLGSEVRLTIWDRKLGEGTINEEDDEVSYTRVGRFGVAGH
jgi:hypothetical protein